MGLIWRCLAWLILAASVAGCASSPGGVGDGLGVGDGTAAPARVAPGGGDAQVIAGLGGAYDDPALEAYVDGIVARLLTAAEVTGPAWTVTVIDAPRVNAFALPDRSLYVTRGLIALANSEDEVAAVLAHEIGHILARHPEARRQKAEEAESAAAISVLIGERAGLPRSELRELARAGQLYSAALVAEYSRDQELEADVLGVGYMAAAGYDPQAAVDFLESLSAQAALRAELSGQVYDPAEMDILSSHPATANRIRVARTVVADLGVTNGAPRDRTAHLDRLDGVLFGDPPSQGYVRDGGFVHPELRFAFRAPEGFRIVNSDRAVSAFDGAGGVFVLEGAPRWPGTLEDFVREAWVPLVIRGSGAAELRDVTPTRINGLAAVRALIRAETEQGRADILLVAVELGEEIYRLTGIAPVGSGLLPKLNTAARSFRPLDVIEAASIEPNRLEIVTVAPGDTVAKLAQAMGVERLSAEEAEARFRILNGLAPDEPLRPGMRVKLIR